MRARVFGGNVGQGVDGCDNGDGRGSMCVCESVSVCALVWSNSRLTQKVREKGDLLRTVPMLSLHTYIQVHAADLNRCVRANTATCCTRHTAQVSHARVLHDTHAQRA